ncbi:MAG: NADPH:quinone reductase [Microvirga sp.]|nr:NADPH:quinone reductase [Microvirga sp.]
MRAAAYEHFGPAREVLLIRELPDQPLGAGEVRVKLAYSGINPTDVKVRGGAPGRKTLFPLIVPHHDGAGTVVETGPGANRLRVGERVWVFGGQNERPFGTAAENIVLPERNVVPLPDGVSLAEGACLGVPPMTAHAAVFGETSPANLRVLVTAGAGNVGRYAIQMARHAGARVIATVSSQEKAEVARAAGAEATVDYRAPDAAARILGATDGRGVDLAIDVDTTANFGLIEQVLANGGRVVSYGSSGAGADAPVRELRLKNATVRFLNILRMPSERLTAIATDVSRLCAAGALTHPVAGTFPLAQTAAAHELVESGRAIGRVLVAIE